MPEEVHEIHERAEKAREHAELAPVTVTIAVLAVLVAAVSLLGHRAHTEQLLFQNRATDQWAYYQAKSIRRHTYELFLDLLSVLNPENAERAEKVRQKYHHEIERYQDQQKESQSEARGLEDEVRREQQRANRYDLGEVLLEAGLVITSITLITRKQLYWRLGTALAVLGLCIAGTGFFV